MSKSEKEMVKPPSFFREEKGFLYGEIFYSPTLLSAFGVSCGGKTRKKTTERIKSWLLFGYSSRSCSCPSVLYTAISH